MAKNFDSILAAIQKAKTGNGGGQREQFWRVEPDKAGNGYAVIRFLPGKTDEDVPFVKVFNHGFKNAAGKWFVEECPTTIGGECPVCASNSVLWNSGIEKDKEIVRLRKRKTSFIANILVISDPANPENEGKVFLFKFGKKIFDKIALAMKPEFQDETPINPFDLDEGANFKVKLRQVEGQANFDSSGFDQPSMVKNQDKVIAEIQDLNRFVDPAKFKSYDEIKAKLDKHLGLTAQRPAPKKEEAPEAAPWEEETKQEQKSSRPAPAAPVADEDDDDFFANLAKS